MSSPRENDELSSEKEYPLLLIEEEGGDSPKDRPPISRENSEDHTGYEPLAAGHSASEAGPSSLLETGKIRRGSGIIESTVRAARPRSSLEARHLSGPGSRLQSAGSGRSLSRAGSSVKSEETGT